MKPIGSPAKMRILCCMGTRPEVIKMAPVVAALKAAPWADCRVLATAQHRHLLDQMLEFFGIAADIDLNIMREDQTLPELTARLIVALDETFARERPNLVLAQGDTTTVFVSALASFYRNVPFGHVEAGLRSHNLRSPFPEEANRMLAGHLSALHFAPTDQARANLLREGIAGQRIHVTGNTVIDAMFFALRREAPIGVSLSDRTRLVLVTAHRRDSFGEPIKEICRAVRTLADRFPDTEYLWPLHPNPSVGPVIRSILDGCARIHLCEPLGYGPFVTAMKRSHLILTDSGGVQEEAPALGKPVLVMRNESERPEAIEAGVVKLVGPNEQRIVCEASLLLSDRAAYVRMSTGASPYGDGKSAGRIVETLRSFLRASSPAPQAAGAR